MDEKSACLNGGNSLDSAENENSSSLRPKYQWSSRSCLNVAVVKPSKSCGNSEIGLNSPRSPVTPSFSSHAHVSSPQVSSPVFRPTCTQPCPFSFDLRDSMQRVARKERLEALRLMEESRATVFKFKANPVRKYKPLVLKQSKRPLTIPRWPFSTDDSQK